MAAEITLAHVAKAIATLTDADVGVTPKSVRESLEQSLGLEKNALKKQEPLIAALLDAVSYTHLTLPTILLV